MEPTIPRVRSTSPTSSPSRSASSTPRRLPGLVWDKKTGVGTLDAKGSSGKRIRRRFVAKAWSEVEKTWLKFRREVEAAKERDDVSHLTDRPAPANLAAPTLNEYFDAFWSGIESRHSESTREGNRWRVAALRAAKVGAGTLGDTRLDVVSTPLLNDMVAAWRREYAPPTINGYLQILKLVLRDAHARRNARGGRILREIQVDKWPRAKEEKLELELTPAERAKLLGVFAREEAFRLNVFNKSASKGKKAKHLPWRSHWERFKAVGPVIALALETGLRKGDLFDLRWREVDFAAGEIRRLQAKTSHDVTIPLSPAARAALHSIAGPRLKTLEKTDQKVCQLFDWGRVLHAFVLAKELAEITRRLRWHDLRHSFGSRLVAGGVPLIAVRDVMGHASIDSTERYARPGAAGVAAVRAFVDPVPEAAESATYDKRAQVAKQGETDTPASGVK